MLLFHISRFFLPGKEGAEQVSRNSKVRLSPKVWSLASIYPDVVGGSCLVDTFTVAVGEFHFSLRLNWCGSVSALSI